MQRLIFQILFVFALGFLVSCAASHPVYDDLPEDRYRSRGYYPHNEYHYPYGFHYPHSYHYPHRFRPGFHYGAHFRF